MKGEANFLGGVASVKGVKGFDPEAAKKRFFEIYLDKVFIFLLMLLFISSTRCCLMCSTYLSLQNQILELDFRVLLNSFLRYARLIMILALFECFADSSSN